MTLFQWFKTVSLPFRIPSFPKPPSFPIPLQLSQEMLSLDDLDVRSFTVMIRQRDVTESWPWRWWFLLRLGWLFWRFLGKWRFLGSKTGD